MVAQFVVAVWCCGPVVLSSLVVHASLNNVALYSSFLSLVFFYYGDLYVSSLRLCIRLICLSIRSLFGLYSVLHIWFSLWWSVVCSLQSVQLVYIQAILIFIRFVLVRIEFVFNRVIQLRSTSSSVVFKSLFIRLIDGWLGRQSLLVFVLWLCIAAHPQLTKLLTVYSQYETVARGAYTA